MRHDDFSQSMKPILSLYRLPKSQAEREHDSEYLSTIFSAVSWIESHQFDEVCNRITQNASPVKKPMPAQFLAVFRELGQKNGWNKAKVNCCQRCEGTGWVDTSITNIETLEHRNVMKSCPGCRSDSGMKDGWIEDVPVTPKSENKTTDWMLKEIQQDYYPPKAAQDLLGKIDETGASFPDEVVTALVEKAGK